MTTASSPGTGALRASARRLTDLAADVRRQAGATTLAAAAPGWHSTAALLCRARLGDAGRDLLGAAVLLERAAAEVDDHARTAARRAAALQDAVAAGALGVVGGLLS